MSQDSLQGLLGRVYQDPEFRVQLMTDPQNALAGWDLSATELMALATNDADGLRRLCGDEVAGYDPLGSPLCGGGGMKLNAFAWQQLPAFQSAFFGVIE